VAIDLTKFERGDSGATVEEGRLAALQLAQIVHRGRAIILFDGLDGAGRRGALRRLAAQWDPCHFAAHDFSGSDSDRHWLARYWASLPGPGDAALFHGSWYREATEERALGRLTDKAWSRRGDEINEFEAQQRDHGTLIVKLFFHVRADVQAERIAARDADAWRRWLAPPQDRQPARDKQLAAWTDLLGSSDTRWAPWTVIDANGDDAGASVALAAVSAALVKAIPLDPPESADKVVPIGQIRA
jgi:polyphosphate kinase 2 (PPK2 family)